jgi:hypothetical protein
MPEGAVRWAFVSLPLREDQFCLAHQTRVPFLA